MNRRAILLTILLTLTACFSSPHSYSQKGPELGKGDTVEIEWAGETMTCKVVEVQANGWVKVKFDNNGLELTPTLPPDQVKLISKKGANKKSNPKPKNATPNNSDNGKTAEGGGDAGDKASGGDNTVAGDKAVAGDNAAADGKAEIRTWVDVTGKHKIKARFVEIDGDNVVLEKADGKRTKIGLAKLSPADRQIATQLASEASPFEDVEEEDAGNRNRNRSRSRDPSELAEDSQEDSDEISEDEILTPDMLSANPVEFDNGVTWSVSADAQIPLSKPVAKNGIALWMGPGKWKKGESGFFESVSWMELIPARGEALVALKDGTPGKDAKAVLCRCDLASAKMVSEIRLPKDVVVLDISPSGDKILTQSEGWGKRKDRLDLWKLDGNKLTREVSMYPYGKDKEVKYAAFVDNDQIVTHGHDSMFVSWKIPDCTPGYSFKCTFFAKLVLSANHKYAIADTEGGTYVIETKSGQPVGLLEGKNHPMAAYAFSGDGTQLACSAFNGISTWDLTTGKLTRQVYLSHAQGANQMIWTDSKHLLLNAHTLVNLDLGVVIWQFNGCSGQYAKELNGETYVVATSGDHMQKRLLHMPIPHKAAINVETSLDSEKLLAIQPGAQVAIHVNTPGVDGNAVREALAAKLQENGVQVVDRSAITLVAEIKMGKTEQVNYRTFGSFETTQASVTPRIHRIAFIENNQTIWETGFAAGNPHFLQTTDNKSIQQAINESSAASVDFFLQASLPKKVCRPGPGGTYGTSQVTVQGLQ